MKKTAILTSLMLSLLVACGGGPTPAEKPSLTEIHGTVRLSIDSNGNPTRYEDQEAAGRTLQMGYDKGETSYDFQALSSAIVGNDLSYSLKLPAMPEAVLENFSVDDENCTYAQNTISVPVKLGFADLELAAGGTLPWEEPLAISPRLLQPQNISIDAVYRNTQLVYADKAVKIDVEAKCQYGAQVTTISTHIQLDKGWNVAQEVHTIKESGDSSASLQRVSGNQFDLILSR